MMSEKIRTVPGMEGADDLPKRKSTEWGGE